MSKKDIVKLGEEELKKGRSLNQVEKDLYEHGLKDKDVLTKAMQKIESAGKKAKAEEAKQERLTAKKSSSNAETPKPKSFSIIFFILLMIVLAILVYLYFTGKLSQYF